MVNTKALKLLLVEDNLTDARWIGEILKEYNYQKSDVRHVKKVTEAIDSLERDDFDAILLDLSLPDSQGIESLEIFQQKAPQLPILILTETNDPTIALQSLRQGAQDYLVKGEFEGKTLTRSIQYAIERQRIEFNIRQQALMKKMLDEIRNSIDLETILKTTIDEIQKFLNTEQVLIYRYESEQSEDISIVASSLDTESAQTTIDRFISAINESSLDSIVSQSISVRAVESTGVDLLPPSLIQDLQAVSSYLILPIWLKESVDCVYEDLTHPIVLQDNAEETKEGLWGMLIAYNTTTPRKWQDWEINFLQKLTTQVTIAIQQSQICCRLQTANQQLQQLAILDGLTNIANRRYFDLVLNKEWQRLSREQKPLSLILCDVDRFKAYNDLYGHQQGDRCLQKIAKILRQSTRRPADLVARYGGEEFAIILPNTEAQGALFIAQTINQTLAKEELPHQKSGVSKYVTCSMGIATTIPNSKQSFTQIIESADKLLYRAKNSGRNQVAVGPVDSYQEMNIK
ncbi:diguanylate cyclase [Waterburya agarophytonicola K14]|uniref:Diguanylate cyclase n=1 Tax=Waterburya agarophytonicola KI4 TaxID=2874699 RepID=A0A964FGC0_9CYAN|nr:diguanylate cyclase [Waterburya agarophytonicola]MCC0178690.1 diguanylate cyclase [Waterburya agarophytonicola KI4]